MILSPCFSDINSSDTKQAPSEKKFLENIDFSVGAGLGYLKGQYREIVYPFGDWKNPYISELLWNLDNIFLLNVILGVSKGPWSINISLGTAVTKGTGEMEDYDWGDSSVTDWTNWSESLIFMDNSIFLDINSTYNYTLNKFLSFPFQLGYKLNHLDWEDEAGEYIYYWNFASNINNYYPVAKTGNLNGVNGIDYKVFQNIIYASAGILFTTGNITTGLNISLSPFIYAWDLDHHILRKIHFVDSFIANFWYETEFTISLKTRTNNKILLRVFREELPETVGDTYSFDEDTSNSEEVGVQTGYQANGAGMASILWGIELSYIWTF